MSKFDNCLCPGFSCLWINDRVSNCLPAYCASHILVQPNFRRYNFLLFDRLSSNSPRSFQRCRRTLRRNFNWIRQQMKNFPIDPIVKIARFRQCCWKRESLIIRDLLGNSSSVVESSWNFTSEFVYNVEMIKVSLIGQKVKIISPKIRLH